MRWIFTAKSDCQLDSVNPTDAVSAIKFGFGTSGIMGAAISNKGRLGLLEHAFQCGIRHYDTAPLYGQGDAERVIGEFASNKRDSVTITTKFGLSPKRYPSYLTPIKPFVRFANRRLKQIKSSILPTPPHSSNHNDAKPDLAPSPKVAPYAVDDIVTQLELSLSKLNTDYLDYFLLHDCQLDNLSDEVVECLERTKRFGKVKQYGLATGQSHANLILAQWPELGSVIQMAAAPFTGFDHGPNQDDRTLISHSLFRGDLVALQEQLRQRKSMLDELIETAGHCAITTHEIMTRFLIYRAARQNPDGILLFSSSSKQRLSDNTEWAKNSELNALLAESILTFI